MVQSIHRLRAGRWLRVLSEIGVGNLMVAIRVMKSVAPSENAPLRDIPIRDTVGALIQLSILIFITTYFTFVVLLLFILLII